jgi:hypothetical protein
LRRWPRPTLFFIGLRRKRLRPRALLAQYGARSALTLFIQGSVASDFALALCSRNAALAPRSPCLFKAPSQATSPSRSARAMRRSLRAHPVYSRLRRKITPRAKLLGTPIATSPSAPHRASHSGGLRISLFVRCTQPIWGCRPFRALKPANTETQALRPGLALLRAFGASASRQAT